MALQAVHAYRTSSKEQCTNRARQDDAGLKVPFHCLCQSGRGIALDNNGDILSELFPGCWIRPAHFSRTEGDNSKLFMKLDYKISSHLIMNFLKASRCIKTLHSDHMSSSCDSPATLFLTMCQHIHKRVP